MKNLININLVSRPPHPRLHLSGDGGRGHSTETHKFDIFSIIQSNCQRKEYFNYWIDFQQICNFQSATIRVRRIAKCDALIHVIYAKHRSTAQQRFTMKTLTDVNYIHLFTSKRARARPPRQTFQEKWQCRPAGVGCSVYIANAKIYILWEYLSTSSPAWPFVQQYWLQYCLLLFFFLMIFKKMKIIQVHQTKMTFIQLLQASVGKLTASALDLGARKVEYQHFKIVKYVWQCDVLVNGHPCTPNAAACQKYRNRWHFSNNVALANCDNNKQFSLWSMRTSVRKQIVRLHERQPIEFVLSHHLQLTPNWHRRIFSKSMNNIIFTIEMRRCAIIIRSTVHTQLY